MKIDSMSATPIFSVVIPAAGLSRRMGCPKLLLPWGESTVIETLIRELQLAGIQQIVIVLRQSDTNLRQTIRNLDVIAVTPELDPPDMRSSIELGLQHIHSNWTCEGGWFLIPADHPLVTAATIKTLRAEWRPEVPQILIPTFGGQRGHPTLFSWNFASEVNQTPPKNGVNWLVRNRSSAICEVHVDDAGVTADMDSPEDYARLRESWQRKDPGAITARLPADSGDST
ncbi:MAG: nboR [Planctomycetaceae bacterium]|nr:nboR [Planctomycetaceae bacterium]